MMGKFSLVVSFVALAVCGFSITDAMDSPRPDVVRLSHDDKKDQIFVNGNWYNKDGSTTTGYIASMSATSEVFSQCLHHFNDSGCDTTWEQRYWVNDQYYKEGGPIFLEVAGEWDASGDINGGYWYNYAKKYGAKMIVLEHRFYGESFPMDNPQVSDLWLMTSQQALADAANFIRCYTSENALEESAWVTFGCSYGGMLAAWMKLKYPELVKTAVSSSGPVEAIYDFPGYMQTCSEVIEAVDQGCSEYLARTFGCMESFTNGSTNSCESYTSMDKMAQTAGYCYSVNWNGNDLSKQNMYTTLAMTAWASNQPSATAFASCQQLRKSRGNDNVEFYGNFMKALGFSSCSNSKSNRRRSTEEEKRGEFLKTKEAWRTGAAGWTWQTCNEFGYYMTSDPIHGSFGRNTFSGNVYGASCSYYYGKKYTEKYVRNQIVKTNKYYGGKNLKSKCVIFVQGTWDPWHTQGVTKAKAGNTVIVVPGTEHCADIGNPNSQAMANAQKQISDQLGRYLKDPKC